MCKWYDFNILAIIYKQRKDLLKRTIRVNNIKWALWGVFMLCIHTLNAQTTSVVPETDKAYTEKLSKSYAARNEKFLADLKGDTEDRRRYKHFESRFEAIFEALNKEIEEGRVINITEIATVTDRVLQEIRAKNPSVPEDIQVLLMRENVPNAYTIGDNTIFMNVGLFYYMESEDQVAAVIAHEIGHMILSHSIKALTYHYEKDKESEEVVRSVRQREVKRTDYALELLKESIYEGGKIRREYETEADSIGYALLKNTKYQHAAILEALEIIDINDTIDYGKLTAEAYRKYFNLPGLPFKDKWLEAEDFSSYNYSAFKPKFDEDSLSTHPEGQERIAHLKSIYPELAGMKKTAEATGYDKVRAIAEKERFPNLYFNERYGEAIYFALISLEKEPENKYYREWLGENLQKIYQARKDYQLNKYLDRVAPKEQTKSYIRFLNFMWNLSLDELKQIAEYYKPQA